VAFEEYADISCNVYVCTVMSAILQLYGIIHICGFAVAVTQCTGPVSKQWKFVLKRCLKSP